MNGYERRRYAFIIREILETGMSIDADTLEEAEYRLNRMYDEGTIDLLRECYDGIDVRPICERCGRDVQSRHAREVNEGFGESAVLCNRCTKEALSIGDLCACQHCGRIYDHHYFLPNPITHERDVCPHCGKVWNAGNFMQSA